MDGEDSIFLRQKMLLFSLSIGKSIIQIITVIEGKIFLRVHQKLDSKRGNFNIEFKNSCLETGQFFWFSTPKLD